MQNKVQLIGNLGNDPEIKNLESGRKMARMTLATNEYYTNSKGERVKETQWHTLVAWGKTAEYAENTLKKGSSVEIEGKLNNRSYTDKEGVKKYVTEVHVNKVSLFEKKKEQELSEE